MTAVIGAFRDSANWPKNENNETVIICITSVLAVKRAIPVVAIMFGCI
jgi:hypothetical protein